MQSRLYPTPEEEARLVEHCAHARHIWNWALSMMTHPCGPYPTWAMQSKLLTERRANTEWLAAGSVITHQQALRDLCQAWTNHWSNPSHFGRPTWRVKGNHEGFRIVGPQAQRYERLSRKRARVKIPKIGWVDFRWTRDIGDPKSYRVKRDAAGRWWIYFAVIPEPINAPGNDSTIGIDRGVTHAFAMDNPRETVDVPKLSPNEKARLSRLQRKLARQCKGSNRREVTKRQIARLRHREINRRKDVIEKLTTRLATEHDVIKIEDLKVQNMMKSAAGTIEEPGKNVAQKRGLNRGIARSGWGLFEKRLEDKAPGRVVRVDPKNTSRRCAVCTHVAKENRKSQAVFECVKCGYRDNADFNAASNIAAGHAVNARGGPQLGPVKREPQPISG